MLDLNAAFDTVDYSILLDHFGCHGSLVESVLSGFHSCVLDSNHLSQREALSFSCTDMVPGPSLEAWLHAFLLSAFQVRLSSLKWKQFGGTQRKSSLTSGLRNSSATSVQLVINTLPLSVLRS